MLRVLSSPTAIRGRQTLCGGVGGDFAIALPPAGPLLSYLLSVGVPCVESSLCLSSLSAYS